MPKKKVLLIGWDAADWNVARPLVEQGKMPNLQRLMSEGVSGNLATIYPILSPMLWTSISTGKRAWKHGIHGFSEPCPKTGSIRPITNLSRKTKTVWNIFNQHGWRSNVIGWWPSHPVESINGIMVSNHFQQASKNVDEEWPMKPGTIYPKELEEALAEMRLHPAELQNEHILPFIPRAAEINQEKDKRMETCAKVIAEISSIHAAGTAAMQQNDWDFTAIYYDGIDHFGHGFMRYHPPKQPWVDEKDFELYKDVIESGYRYHDMMLGTLLTLAGEDTTVMLISDHGFEPGILRPKTLPNEPAGPAAEHSPFGMFCLSGPGIKRGETIHGASLLDITPTLLHLYGLPVGKDMDGKVLLNCFEAEQTVDFIDSWDNIKGEYGDGRHPPGAELDVSDSRESLQRLVELGYIDEPNADQSKAIDETIRELKYNLAQAYMDGSHYQEASEILQNLWERWPNESRFGTKLLSCALEMKDAEKARRTFDLQLERKKIASEAAQEELKSLLEEIEQKRKKTNEKTKDEEDVLEELPRSTQQKIRKLKAQAGSNPYALAFLAGSVLTLEGKHEEALEVLEKAKEVQTANQPSLYSKIGEVHLQLEQWKKAEEAFRTVLTIAPNNHGAHLGLARIFLRQNNFFESAAHSLASLELIFHQPQAHFIYAQALRGLQKPKLAEQSLLTAVTQNPNYPAAYEVLAEIQENFYKDKDAAASYRKLSKNAETNIKKIRSGEAFAAHKEEAMPELEKVSTVSGKLKPGLKNAVVIVSGLPRSGTSLMMQMLEAADIPIVTDAARGADESNPKGYYEDKRIKGLGAAKAEDRAWITQETGKAIKIVAPLLGHVPASVPSRIIFMQRSLDEILESQGNMLARDGKSKEAGNDLSIAKAFALTVGNVGNFVAQREKTEILPIDYSETVADPKGTAEKVAKFLGSELDIEKMAAVVDPSLYRSKGK